VILSSSKKQVRVQVLIAFNTIVHKIMDGYDQCTIDHGSFIFVSWLVGKGSPKCRGMRAQNRDLLLGAMLNNPSRTIRLTYGGHHGSVGTSTTIAYDTFEQQLYVNMAF